MCSSLRRSGEKTSTKKSIQNTWWDTLYLVFVPSLDKIIVSVVRRLCVSTLPLLRLHVLCPQSCSEALKSPEVSA